MRQSIARLIAAATMIAVAGGLVACKPEVALNRADTTAPDITWHYKNSPSDDITVPTTIDRYRGIDRSQGLTVAAEGRDYGTGIRYTKLDAYVSGECVYYDSTTGAVWTSGSRTYNVGSYTDTPPANSNGLIDSGAVGFLGWTSAQLPVLLADRSCGTIYVNGRTVPATVSINEMYFVAHATNALGHYREQVFHISGI